MNETINTLLTRRSVRRYKADQVSDELLDTVLNAGQYAASGMNSQNTVLVAVRDSKTRDHLSKMNAAVMGSSSDPFYGAPCVIVVLANTTRGTWVEDGSLVIGNLMAAAHSVGLGSCWIHRARQVFDAPEGKALLEKWGLPTHLRGVGNCILGYPSADHPQPAPRKDGRILKID